jgi:hypothetical protein
MGLILDEVIGGIVDGGAVPLAIATNDDTLLVTYATGYLVYHEALFVGSGLRPATLATTSDAPLKLLFSHEKRVIDPVVGDLVPSPRQPFNADVTERLGASVSLLNAAGPTFTLTRGRRRFSVATTLHNRVYVGDGPSFGGALGTVYLFAFDNVLPPSLPVRRARGPGGARP